MVHEFGHNLGMSHDFDYLRDEEGTPLEQIDRYANDKVTLCTGGGGFMDYGRNSPDQYRWSKCSNEDFEKVHSRPYWNHNCMPIGK